MEIQTKIKNSRFLSAEQKTKYIQLSKVLSADKLQELYQILDDAEAEANQIDSEATQEKQNLNKTFLQDSEKAFKEGEKEAQGQEVQSEQEQASDILNQINNS